MTCLLPLTLTAAITVLASWASAADKPIKTFICAGQSSMVGWGDSTKLSDDLREGNDPVLMFEDGKWQPLRPHSPANQGQRRVGLTEFHFGPEIAFAHEIAKAWPNETIGFLWLQGGGDTKIADVPKGVPRQPEVGCGCCQEGYWHCRSAVHSRNDQDRGYPR